MAHSTLQIWISYHRRKEAHFCFQDSPFSLLVFISLPRESPSHTNHVASSLRLESHILWAVYKSQVVFPGHFVKLDSCTFTLQSNRIVLLDNIATDNLQSTDWLYDKMLTDINTGDKKGMIFHWALIVLVLSY